MNSAEKTIVIAGASGLVGTALCDALTSRGYICKRLVRRSVRSEDELFWDPYQQDIDPAALEGVFGVVILSGESIAGLRWTEDKKKRLRRSRIETTSFLTSVVRQCERKPTVFIQASAIGYYGERAAELCVESDAAGDDFLATLCVDWEKSSQSLVGTSVRRVCARFGVILSNKGGALATMLPAFRFGLGGPIADGRQFMSWVTLQDVVGGLLHCIETPSAEGPINFVAPEAVTNGEFTNTLASVLHRPAFFRVPKTIILLALGEMGKALLLTSTKVSSEKLETLGYTFRHATLESALQDILSE